MAVDYISNHNKNVLDVFSCFLLSLDSAVSEMQGERNMAQLKEEEQIANSK